MNSAKRHTGLCHLYWGDGKENDGSHGPCAARTGQRAAR